MASADLILAARAEAAVDALAQLSGICWPDQPPPAEVREASLAMMLARDAAKRGDLRAAEQEIHDARLAIAVVFPPTEHIVVQLERLWHEAVDANRSA